MVRTSQNESFLEIVLTFWSHLFQNIREHALVIFFIIYSHLWDAVPCVMNSGRVHPYLLSSYYSDLPGKKGTGSCAMHPGSLWTHRDFHPVSSACGHSLSAYRIQRNTFQTPSEQCQQEHLQNKDTLRNKEGLQVLAMLSGGLRMKAENLQHREGISKGTGDKTWAAVSGLTQAGSFLRHANTYLTLCRLCRQAALWSRLCKPQKSRKNPGLQPAA